MRVVQVLTQRTGGPVDHAIDVACVLARRGGDAHVLGPTGPGTERARRAGVTWHDVSIDDARDLTGVRRAVELLGSLRAEVTHLHDRRAGWLGRLLGPRLPGGLVYTLHGVPDGLSDLVAGNTLVGARRRRDRLYYLHGERWVTRWSRARVVVPSHAVADYAVRHVGLPTAILDVVPHGVDLVRFSPGERPGGGPVTAVWVGLLGEVKRPGLLLDAVARVPQLRLRLVGDGPLYGAVRDQVETAGLGGRVELLGARPEPALVLAGADLFVLTSAAENLPLSLLQAMACGLPVVSTSVGGVAEVVREGRDGLLVPPDDLDALVAALTRMAEDRATREARGRSARARAEDAFGIERCVDQLVSVYERSAAERAGVGAS